MTLSTFKDVVDFAIKREEEAIKGYGEMAEIAKNPGLKELLQELQAEERNHKKLLQELTEGTVQDFQPGKVIDLKISDYMIEEPLDESMDFKDVLIFAAKKEQSAVELYSRLKEETDSKELKNMFDFMVEQEKNHKLKLETEYEKFALQED